MIFITALVASAGGVGTPSDQIYLELNRKLSHVGFQTVVDQQGNLKDCIVTSSSGDVGVDQIFCDALRACLPPGTRQTADSMPALTVCTDKTQKEMLRTLAEQRAAKK